VRIYFVTAAFSVYDEKILNIFGEFVEKLFKFSGKSNKIFWKNY
jgi:hypothetical protein